MFCRPSPSKAVALTSRLSSLPSYSSFSDSTYTYTLSRDITGTHYMRSRSNLQGCYCEFDEKELSTLIKNFLLTRLIEFCFLGQLIEMRRKKKLTSTILQDVDDC
jgi:hypothetical protein